LKKACTTSARASSSTSSEAKYSTRTFLKKTRICKRYYTNSMIGETYLMLGDGLLAQELVGNGLEDGFVEF